MPTKAKKVLVPLAAGAEEMEVTILVDVLRRADVEVVLAGVAGADPVVCSRGVTLVPDVALAQVVETAAQFDVIVLPGGVGGTEQLCASALVGDLLRQQERAGKEIAAICAAPLALVRHGVCAGARMTSHPSVQAEVTTHGVLTDGAVVRAPGLTTSMGPGTAFEFALRLVADLAGADVAEVLRASMLVD